MTFSPDASDVYRTHVTKFVPSSGYNEPSLDEIRALLAQYEAVMNAFTTNGGLIYQTMAAMNAAATTFTEPRSAWQFEAGSEGIYVLNPTTNTWTKVGRLPYDFVIGTDTGAGTANAIKITTDIPVADGMIVAFPLFESTVSSPVTISINGGSALTLKTNRANNASGLTAGMEIWGRISTTDSTFRLLNDQDVSALVAQAELARDDAVEIRDEIVEIFSNATVDITSNLGVKLDTSTIDGQTDYEFTSPVPVGKEEYIRVRLGGVELYFDEYEIVSGGTNNILRLIDNPGAAQRVYVVGAMMFSTVSTIPPTGTDDITNNSGVSGATLTDALNTAADGLHTFSVWSGGSFRTLRDRMRYVCHISDFNVDLTGTNDDTADVQAWLTQSASTGVAVAERGKVAVSSTLIIPAGTIVRGAGRKDEWEDNYAMVSSPKGTVFVAAGSGNAARWTDITGSDGADDTPLFVAAGNGVYLEDITMYTSGGSAWSIGLLIPSVKQCGIRRVSGFGFTDGTLYLDGTWSHLNATLKALHPEIDPSTGMNEFTADDCWLEAGGSSGFAYKIQGTTRAGDVVPTFGDWIWAPGGVGSDCRMSNTRLGATGASGGCFSYDAQLFGTGAGGTSQYGRGAAFQGVAFRSTGGARYWMKLDRCEGLTLDACYSEGGPYNELAITSRTKAGVQGIKIGNDRSISGDLSVAGVVVNTTSKRRWEQTRCISWENVRGGLSLANFRGHAADGFYDMPEIASFYAAGRSIFSHDDGSTRTEYFQMRSDAPRPVLDNVMNWGTATNRIATYYGGSASINTSDLREKLVLGRLDEDEALMRVAARLARQNIAYQWQSAVAEKGAETARIHFGAGAQTVGDAFIAEGLDPERYAIWCKDYLYDTTVEVVDGVEAETHAPRLDADGSPSYRLGLRSDLLHSLMAAYYARKIEDLEGRLAAIEERR